MTLQVPYNKGNKWLETWWVEKVWFMKNTSMKQNGEGIGERLR